METLQGVSIPELTSLEGRKWRTAYSDPASTERVGLEDTVWPVVFAQMEQFIKDVNLTPDVLELDYTPVINMYTNGEAAMISGITIQVEENEGVYTLTKVQKDGKEIKDDETFSVTCLATYAHFAPFLEDESRVFTEGNDNVKNMWTDYVKEGGVVLSQPEGYITLK